MKTQAFELADLLAARAGSGRLYHEFLKAPSMRLGIYELPAGGDDPQQPHVEDEVYYVLSGRATIRVAGEDRAVRPGSVVFVAAGVEHRFHTIEADLSLLVCFAAAPGPGHGQAR